MGKRKAIEEETDKHLDKKYKEDAFPEDIKDVRKCIVRISFDWQKNWKPSKKGHDAIIVIPGVIISVSEGRAVILADQRFFKKSSKFRVNFPCCTGYEEEIQCAIPKDVTYIDKFVTFKLKPKHAGYIRAATFEEEPPKDGDIVHAFVFPRENLITPIGFCPGSIISQAKVSSKPFVLFHACPLHEYGYFGSPVVNKDGHFVGVTFNDQGRNHAWTVKQLKDKVLHKHQSINYVSNGVLAKGSSA